MMTDIATPTSDQGGLIVRAEGSAGVIRLNRPQALNAFTLEMVHGVDAALTSFEADPAIGLVIIEGAGERGLCAGGDIRSLYDSIRAGGDLGKTFWRDEYILNARIAAYPKPYVAFMDGIVMGGGVGLSAHGRHRVVTEKTRVAMPEVGIGFFPDVGGTWLLANAPGETGTYFGLTGQTMNGADAIRAGLADVFIASEQWPTARDALLRLGRGATSGMVRGVLNHFAADHGPGPIEQQRKLIDQLFGHDTVEEIIAALQADGSEFAQTTLRQMQEKSPTSLKLTLRLLRLARTSPSLRVCLVREYGAALEIFVNKDFPEGIRAAVIDKDRAPKWQPPRLEDVSEETLAPYFAPRGADELVFPPYR
jgi:enoyl-CoA hydratase